MKYISYLLTLSLMTGCASIFDGTTQSITVNTTPPNADCQLMRDEQMVGEVSSTPGAAKVEKGKHDINVVCHHAGYDETTHEDVSGVSPWIFGNVLIGGLIGLGIDWGTGAIHKYDTPVDMTLASGNRHSVSVEDDKNKNKDQYAHEKTGLMR